MKLERVIAVRNNKTIYRDGDRCVKVFDDHYSKADVLNEALNQARIEETGLNIPKILETPYINKEYPPYKQEIEMIKNKEFDPELKEKLENI